MYGNRPCRQITNHNLKPCAMRERLPSFSSVGHHRADHDFKVTNEVFACMIGKIITKT